ncbi:MAG: aspartyl protease family protein [Pyrinomonadaceae bacterium]
MVKSLKRVAACATTAFLIFLAQTIRAAPTNAAAHLFARRSVATAQERNRFQTPQRDAAERTSAGIRMPFTARFRQSQGRGLLVKTWVNGAGPYTFAIDTGAGATILSTRVAQEARVGVTVNRSTPVGGLNGANSGNSWQAKVRSLAIGDAQNFLPARGYTIVADRLPSDLDGILDPTESYWPLGYTIDIPRGEISSFDPQTNPLRFADTPAEGTVVPWIFEGSSRRPYVMLDNGRHVLLDTGSNFGLALSETVARSFGIITERGRDRGEVRDIVGTPINARRVRATTVRVGALSLRGVPTDLLSGIERGAPILLGREALEPFRLQFDPVNRLISIAPVRLR